MKGEITAFGAVGDGKTVNTEAIQAAVDRRSESGGGRVTVPPGVFVTGTLFLKDNVELHLEAGAVLRGSPDLADYNRDDCFEQNVAFARENVTGAHLLIAHEARNVSLTGQGVVDGNGRAFFGDIQGGKYAIRDWRPGQMVYFCECERVRVEGVSLNNAPYWTCFLHGCENVIVRGVSIDNPRETRNGDGIDIDCCRNVAVSDCLIASGDDCITLRASNRRLKNKDRACEHVAVSNCVLSTPCNALRIGVGDGVIRNAVFSNLVVRATRNGICLVSKYSERQTTGATIQNLRFSNLVMDTVMPFYIARGYDATAAIENIYFSDIRATACKTSCLYGNSRGRLKNIQFRNVDVEVTGGREFMGDREPDPCVHREWSPGWDTAFFVARCDDVRFRNLTLTWSACDAPWAHAFRLKDNGSVEIDRDRLAAPPGAGAGAAVRQMD